MNHLIGKVNKRLLLAIDIGFFLYWILVTLSLIPQEWVFRNYDDPNVNAWNWSFLPLDIAASITGLLGIKDNGNRSLLIVSTTLTVVAGGMALAFWSIQGFFSLGWWLPNIFLFASGLIILIRLVNSGPK